MDQGISDVHDGLVPKVDVIPLPIAAESLSRLESCVSFAAGLRSAIATITKIAVTPRVARIYSRAVISLYSRMIVPMARRVVQRIVINFLRRRSSAAFLRFVINS